MLRGLHDQNAVTETVQNAVSGGEVVTQGPGAQGVLANECAARRDDLARQLSILGRIDLVESVGENRDGGAAARFQSSTVCGAVDAERQA